MLNAEASKIAEQAKREGKWLYDPSYKRWHTPEDFMHIYNYANAKEEFLAQLQIRHPEEGIKAGFTQLSALQDKLQVFAIRVAEYYKST